MKLHARVMENTLAYRAWQAPFAEQKLAPLFAHNDMSRVRRVLDVGCGPGTNTQHFANADYLGIDFNPAYIESARRRHGREFVVADVTKYEVSREERFDLILANSLFHHIDTANTARILAHLATLLSDDGHVHVLDLVLPPQPSVSRFLARADRGEHPRPLEEWRTLFTDAFEPVVFEPYPLGMGGVTLWNMVYFKGRARR
ncbi:MAG TPA: class I SAM-dependent methyltransferase [Gemmatimonadaceae bacterium]|nr:class I SAM-dependent methyltransferase [Gemmatimonadaceae bacterium]